MMNIQAFALGMSVGMLSLGVLCLFAKVGDGITNRFFLLGLFFLILGTHEMGPL